MAEVGQAVYLQTLSLPEVVSDINLAIADAAKRANEAVRPSSGSLSIKPHLWSPDTKLLYEYSKWLKITKRRISKCKSDAIMHFIPQSARAFVKRFTTPPKKGDTINKYAALLPLYLHTESATSNYAVLCEPTTRQSLIEAVDKERSRVSHLTHATQAMARHKEIKCSIAQRSALIRAGKLRKPIQSILEMPSPRGFAPITDMQQTTHIRPKGAHTALLNHWSDHFNSTNNYITQAGLYDPSAHGKALRERIIVGTWHEDPYTREHLLRHIPDHQRQLAANLQTYPCSRWRKLPTTPSPRGSSCTASVMLALAHHLVSRESPQTC